MEIVDHLKKLVESLQDRIRENLLDNETVKSATASLARIGYEYDANLFPELPVNAAFSSNVGHAPNNLAEALLWKMGKWNVYKDFVRNFDSNDPLVKKTDVVFAAFAKHLANSDNPIYDQHALRAMWAINITLESFERDQCKSALVKSKGEEKGKWKATLSGKETITCYNLYVTKINTLTKNGIPKSALDRLLMPLGQALKDNSRNYNEFIELCGLAKNG